MNFDRFHAMSLFTRVVETGSFTAAARERALSQPAVTKAIASLEAHLGTRLLNRTTRRVSLTDEGGAFYEDARRILEGLDEAESRVGRQAKAPAGRLKVAVPSAFGRLQIVPLIPGFLAEFPLVTIDLVMGDSPLDLMENAIDVAIRVGQLPDSSLTARRIGTARRIAVASRAYLNRAGRPTKPEDLSDHDCIVLSPTGGGTIWTFSGQNGPIPIEVDGPFRTNNSEAVRDAVLAGLGIALNPNWLFADGLKVDCLEEVLQPFRPKDEPIQAVFPASRYRSAKTRSFADHVERAFASNPLLRR